MWLNNWWIMFAFVSLCLRCSRPFDVLCPRCDGSFAVEQMDNRKWRAKASLAQTWRKLQENLLTLCMQLNAHSNIYLPLDSQLFHLPDVYGYGANCSYSSRLRAQRAALDSAAAFRILMAVCSLYMAHNYELIGGKPRWEAALAQAGIAGDEITLYRRSELSEPAPRATLPQSQYPHMVLLGHDSWWYKIPMVST